LDFVNVYSINNTLRAGGIIFFDSNLSGFPEYLLVNFSNCQSLNNSNQYGPLYATGPFELFINEPITNFSFVPPTTEFLIVILLLDYYHQILIDSNWNEIILYFGENQQRISKLNNGTAIFNENVFVLRPLVNQIYNYNLTLPNSMLMKSFFIQVAKQCIPGNYFEQLPDDLAVCYLCPDKTYNFGESTYSNCPNMENNELISNKKDYSIEIINISLNNRSLKGQNIKLDDKGCMVANSNYSKILSGYLPDRLIIPNF
jgi:hypothetical protein